MLSVQEIELPYDLLRGDWNGDLVALAGAIRRGLGQVDAIFVNSGLWEVPEFSGNITEAERQLRSLEGLVRGGGTPVWMTTTATQADYFNNPMQPVETSLGYKAAKQLGWSIFDRYGMTWRLAQQVTARVAQPLAAWVDRVHFKPYVSNEFGNVVLNMLCSIY
jgi:hypothetical protein